MNFIPEQPKIQTDVPYFDDVLSDGGWQGHTTQKTLQTLQSEIVTAISRLGGIVSGFHKGSFNAGETTRQGYRVFYSIQTPDNKLIPGQIDIAALPVRYTERTRNSYESRQQKSMKMALYMLGVAINGLWFLQQLSPGYAPLMPFMLTGDGKTVSQLWSESNIMNNLLPPGEDFIEGEVKVIK